jgi:hypothetical protein
MNIKSRVDKLSKSIGYNQLTKEEMGWLAMHRRIKAMTPLERTQRIDNLISKRTA